jgi:putative oxidoreductase
MMKTLFSPTPIWGDQALAVVRIVTGLLLAYHGLEVFDAELMRGYAEWDMFKGSAASFMVYSGKGAELIAGIFLVIGLFTRVCGVIVIATFLYITFLVGHGKFWYEDQHPFMFVLLGFLFTFLGPGAWSVDAILFKKNK